MIRRLIVWNFLILTCACAHVRRAPLGYNVSSERSDYSLARDCDGS